MSTDQKYSCQGCDRTDLTLTANWKVRSHAANGKRTGPDNPACGMGSEYPKESTEFHTHLFDGYNDHQELACVCSLISPPAASQETPKSAHTHVFEYADDGNGHSGSFCYCGMEEPTGPALEPDHGPVRAMAPPNPFRDPLPGGVHDSMGLLPHDRNSEDPATAARAGAPVQTLPSISPAGPVPSAYTERDPVTHDLNVVVPSTDPDAFLDGVDDEPETSPDSEGDARRYFPARYDGTCVTCLDHFEEGDMITRTPEGKWEAQDCCGEDAVPSQDRPKAVARTLPVSAGRYRFPHPVTGKPTSGQRASKYAEGIQDKYLLDQWRCRMVVLGMSIRPDLVEKTQSALRNDDPAVVAKQKREYLNKIAEDAKLAAGSKKRAEKGTTLHKHTEELDGGLRTLEEIPEEYRRDTAAYASALDAAGFRPVKDLIERSVYLDEMDVAGTFDRVLLCVRDTEVIDLDGRPVQIKSGEFVVGDVKSGDNIESPWLEILVQLALYSHALNENGVAQQDEPDGPWRWVPLKDMGVPSVREDVGIVMHVPYGSGECKLYYADLILGWRGAKLCKQNRDFWKIKLPKQPVMSVSAPEETGNGDSAQCSYSCLTDGLNYEECAVHNPKQPESVNGSEVGEPAPDPEPPAKNIMDAVKQTKDAACESVRLGFEVPTAATVKMPTGGNEVDRSPITDPWEGRFRAVRTREAANKVWAEAKAAGLPADEIKRLVSLVQLGKPDQEQKSVSAPAAPAPVHVPEPAPEPAQKPDGPTLTQRAHAVTSKAEAAAVFKEARALIDGMGTQEKKDEAKTYLDKLVKIMKDRLASA